MNKSAINGNVVVIMSKSTNNSTINGNVVVIMIHEQVNRRLQLYDPKLQKYKLDSWKRLENKNIAWFLRSEVISRTECEN